MYLHNYSSNVLKQNSENERLGEMREGTGYIADQKSEMARSTITSSSPCVLTHDTEGTGYSDDQIVVDDKVGYEQVLH